MPRVARLLTGPIIMLAIAGVLAFWGIQIVTSPSPSSLHWMGWLLLGASVLKATVWIVVARLRLRYLR